MATQSPPQIVIALDLGATKLAGALISEHGRLWSRITGRVAGRRGAAVGTLVQHMVRRLCQRARRAGHAVKALGVCVPGIADAQSGRVWAPNIAGWDDFPLRETIRAALPAAELPVVVDSDRAACILGESWRGAARGCRHAIFLAVGTGIGAGILVDGRVLRGAHDVAGAIGWMALSQPFRPAYRECGDFEFHASGTGLARAAREEVARRPDYRGALRRRGALSAREVFAAYAAGDPVASRVIAQAIRYWGAACANLVSLFNPEKIIFGGGVFGPATRLLPAIRAEARKWAQPVAMRRVRLVASQLGSDAALYGAGYLALREVVARR
ncbi:MAG: ROK family protein [Verrucomicrobiae bacterium]|nr:ROK family protein [Verrucomicrobiae bacterium]